MDKAYKLTLSVKADTARRAKKYARSRNTSVTKLVESYLLRLTEAEDELSSDEEFLKTLHPSIRAIAGIMTEKEMERSMKNLRSRLKKRHA